MRGEGDGDVRSTRLARNCEERKRLTRDGFVIFWLWTVTENIVPRREMICCLVMVSTWGLVSHVPFFGGREAVIAG